MPFFKERPFDSITDEDVDGPVDALEDKGLAPKTIRDHVGTLSALFTFAMAPKGAGAITNPCVGVELPAAPEAEEIRFLMLDEVDRLLAHVQPGMYAESDRVMLMAAVMTGMRKGELVALRWRDVDWAAGRIRVRATTSVANSRPRRAAEADGRSR